VVADDDGGVIVPAELADETIRRALAKAPTERGLRDALEAGSALRDAYDRFGVL
jgi:4-hydroxy-4-methyl-2-oxoglutarate aldolase